MISLNRILLPVLFGLFAWSCGSKVEEPSLNIIKVDLDGAQETPLSAVASNVEYIALETTENNLISVIREIEHNDKFIFISDYNSLYQFSIDGSFIKKIGRNGEGPGEFLGIHGMAIDWEKSHIYLAATRNHKLICLDFNGQLVKEVKFTPSWIDGLNFINGKLSIIATAMGQPSDKEGMRNNDTYRIELLEDLSFGDSTRIRSVNVLAGVGAAMPLGMSFMSEARGNEFVYFPVPYKESIVRDTLYQIVDNKLVPHTKIDFGVVDRTTGNLLIRNMLRTADFLIANYSYKRYAGVTLIHLPSLSMHSVKGDFQDDIFNTGEAKLIPWDYKTDQFYFVKEAYDLEGIIEGLDVEGNPYIFIVKLEQ